MPFNAICASTFLRLFLTSVLDQFINEDRVGTLPLGLRKMNVEMSRNGQPVGSVFNNETCNG